MFFIGADGVVGLRDLDSYVGVKETRNLSEQTTPSPKRCHPSFTKEGSSVALRFRG